MDKAIALLSNKNVIINKLKEVAFVGDVEAWLGENAPTVERTSKLQEFLSLPPEERVVTILGERWEVNFKVQEHEVVPRKEFAKLFEAWSLEEFINEPDVFAEFGFYSPTTRVYAIRVGSVTIAGAVKGDA